MAQEITAAHLIAFVVVALMVGYYMGSRIASGDNETDGGNTAD